MSDQCKACGLHGEFVKCYTSDCFKHQDWFQHELMERYERAMSKAESARLAEEQAREALEIALRLLEVLDEVDAPNSALLKICEALALLKGGVMGIDRMAFEGGNDPSVHTTTGNEIKATRPSRESALERLLREAHTCLRIIENDVSMCAQCRTGAKRVRLAIDAALKEGEHGSD